MEARCAKCGGPTEAGVATALGLIGEAVADKKEPRLVFVAPGTPTSPNPVEAFKQGLADERADAGYLIRGRRCTRCGFLEFFATEKTVV
jgi:hypothetical protein